jgi:hypothetical protein
MRSAEELFQELRQRRADTAVYEIGLAIAFEHVVLTVPATVADALPQIRRAIEHGGVPVGFLWFDRTGLRAAPLREWSKAEWPREVLVRAGGDLLEQLEQLEAQTDSLGNRNAGGRYRIPKSFRDALRADADQAARQGDRFCAQRLSQIADYEGGNAPRQVRELGIKACDKAKYSTVAGLMRLVRFYEAEQQP